MYVGLLSEAFHAHRHIQDHVEGQLVDRVHGLPQGMACMLNGPACALCTHMCGSLGNYLFIFDVFCYTVVKAKGFPELKCVSTCMCFRMPRQG